MTSMQTIAQPKMYQVYAKGEYTDSIQGWTVPSKCVCKTRAGAEKDIERLRKILESETTLFGKRINLSFDIKELEVVE